MNQIKWTTHYVNSVEEIGTLELVVKNFYSTKFRIDEIRFKTLEFRKEFQTRLLTKFLKVYEGTDLKNQVDVNRLFATIQETWVTEYGTIKISDLETIEQEEKKNVRIR